MGSTTERGDPTSGAHAIRGEAIEIGCLDFATMTTEIRESHVICEDHDDVGLRRSRINRAQWGKRGENRCGDDAGGKLKPGEKAQNTELGRGTIDWKPVLGAAAEAGTEWHLFEQNCEDRSALESIRTSYEYLKSLDAV